jgi:GNAT superfamily N-acetyltransferase
MDDDLPQITLRAAAADEGPIITRHRRAMFAEMRHMPDDQLDALDASFGPWVAARLERGEYHGWFAVNAAGQVVGGAGLWLMDWPPHALHLEPRRANILNVYVEPQYRRRGLARALTDKALDWCRHNRVRMVILHASPAGRPIYESLGFAPTNEMSRLLDLGQTAPGASPDIPQ